MALKKPSEYFKKDIPSVDNSVQELVKAPELNTFSDAFDAFKNNLSKIEVLSNFSETLDNYRVNIERVNHLSSSIEDIKTEVQTLLKKEDLDRAMMSQLLVVEQSIRDVQNKVKGINEKNLTEIRLDVSGLTNSVNEFLENDVPKYKKLIVDSELRTNTRYEELEDNVNQTLEGIGEFVENKYQQLTETLEGINEKSLAGILEDFKVLESNLQKIQEEDIPKYKGFIVETERKTETKLNEFDEKFSNSLTSFEDKIVEDVEQKYSYVLGEFEKIQEDIPKYKGFIVETELKTENKINEFQQKLNETVDTILGKINLIEDDKNELVSQVVEKIDDVNKLSKQVSQGIKTNESFTKDLETKITDLEINIVRNETHIKVQNKNLQAIQEEVKDTLRKINLEVFEEKSEELANKIKYIDEIFDKFSEKEIFAENLLTQPPSTDTKDPLTPLDQKFVTLEQLQEHYRLFINRIQQQLATIGGGGETKLYRLDDVDRNSVRQDGYVLQYSEAVGKFIGTSYVPGGGGNVAIAITNIAPLSPKEGNLWYDIDIGRTFVYYTDVDGSQWVDIAPSGSSNVGSGSSLTIYDGYPNLVGIVTAIDFGANLTVSSVSSGIVTVSSSGGGGESYWVSNTSGIHTTSNIGIGTTNAISKITVGEVYGVDTTVTGLSTTAATTIDSFSSTIFRSSKLQIQISQGTDYQATDLLVIHDGSVVSLIEYGSIATNDYLGSFGGTLSGGNVIVNLSMNSGSSATVKVVSNKITI